MKKIIPCLLLSLLVFGCANKMKRNVASDELIELECSGHASNGVKGLFTFRFNSPHKYMMEYLDGEGQEVDTISSYVKIVERGLLRKDLKIWNLAGERCRESGNNILRCNMDARGNGRIVTVMEIDLSTMKAYGSFKRRNTKIYNLVTTIGDIDAEFEDGLDCKEIRR